MEILYETENMAWNGWMNNHVTISMVHTGGWRTDLMDHHIISLLPFGLHLSELFHSIHVCICIPAFLQKIYGLQPIR